VLTGTDPDCVRGAAFAILNDRGQRGRIPEKWDGEAGRRIVTILLRETGSKVELSQMLIGRGGPVHGTETMSHMEVL
jgi:hypothetical protein